ncbi:BPTI/Kunitz domain-containing protein [uncultured Pontibacter sp.]|uniref:BPTI/Kunitz domain-containing protein n=1 Tax=uncultured Pontibacter sp. TaxID=453356 RepID=UPI00260C59C5|nr:BPTI/Kunitz domain-containing protein [uncultured Pontibacter sp.]
MKSKTLSITILFAAVLGLASCEKECETSIAACTEKPPTDELCLAAFNRWFYNEDKNKCEEIRYSGCTLKGFETKQECEQCKCG